MKRCRKCGAEIPGDDDLVSICEKCNKETLRRAHQEALAEYNQAGKTTTSVNQPTAKPLNAGYIFGAILFVVFGIGFMAMHAMGFGVILFFIGLYLMTKIND